MEKSVQRLVLSPEEKARKLKRKLETSSGSSTVDCKRSRNTIDEEDEYETFNTNKVEKREFEEGSAGMSGSKSGNFIFDEKDGDLFNTSNDTVLVHFVRKTDSEIAKQFRRRFEGSGESLTEGKKAGKMAVIERHNRVLYYLMLKEKELRKSRLKKLELCLTNMRKRVQQDNVRKVAMHTLDEPIWSKVKQLIQNIFQHVNVHITMYNFKKDYNVPAFRSNSTINATSSNTQLYLDRFINKPKKPNHIFKFEKIFGNLFDAPEDVALAHCVAEDMLMNAGIAIEFRIRFNCTGELLDQKKMTGQVAVIERNGRFIYYLVTKKFSQGKPTMNTLRQSLIEMSKHVKDNNVKKIAMPIIGCGLDRLNWSDVKELICCTFQHLNVHVTIYDHFQLRGSTVFIKNMTLKQMPQNGTIFAYFVGEDLCCVSEAFKNLHHCEDVMQQLRKQSLRSGQVARAAGYDQDLLALVCLDKYGNVCYKDLENCMRALKREKLDNFVTIGVETSTKNQLEVKKLMSILKFSYERDIQIWICCSNTNCY